MKHVFIIPEPHLWDKSFKNRRDYPAEIASYLAEVVQQINRYDGEKIIIFPGDIFHRSYTTLSGLFKAINWISYLNNITNNKVYSCVGNHELSYPQSNPFWIMADDCTTRYESLKHVEAYASVEKRIKIVDHLDVGKLRFIFGHYSRTDLVDTSDKDLVYISHNTILEPEIVEHIANDLERDVNVEYMTTSKICNPNSIPITERLKYVFVGHMHTFYSAYHVDEMYDSTHLDFQLQYLGSLGRTAINEIINTDLERTIPHFIISDSDYSYEPFTIQLSPREDIVIEEIAEHNSEVYQTQKAIKHLKETNVFGVTAEQAITRALAEDPEALHLFSSLYYHQPDVEILNLIQEAKL